MANDDKTPILGESTSIGSGFPATPEDYDEAISLDSWTAREALCWLKGTNPFWFRGDIFAYWPYEGDYVRRAVLAGVLHAESSPPRQWVEWAANKRWNIPPELAPLLPTRNRPQDSGSQKSRGRPPCKWTVEFLRLYDLFVKRSGGGDVTLANIAEMADVENSRWILTKKVSLSNSLQILDDHGEHSRRPLRELNRLLKKHNRKHLRSRPAKNFKK